MAWIVRRQRKTGVFWYVRYSIQGKRAWLSAGRSRSSAEKIKAKIETELAEGRFLDKRTESDWTLGQLKTVYLERLKASRPRSAKWRKERFGRILALVSESTKIEQIGPDTLDRYVARRVADGRAISTINGEVAILRHALHMAYRWQAETGLSEYRLAAWKPLRGRPRVEPVFLSPRQVKRLLQVAKRKGGAGYVFLRAFLATGARPAELLALTPASFSGNVLHLRTLKHGPERRVELDPALARELRSAIPLQASGYRRFWRSVRSAAGLGGIRLYDLRHTAASEMLRRGMSLREVQKILGHATARMTERYAHFAKDAKPPRALDW